MLNFGLLGFAHPWLLLALASVPLLWLLLRVTPPAPRKLAFPAIRLLSGLQAKEETPARTPPWLMLLRMLIVILIILGLAQPLLNPAQKLSGSGPLVLVIDDGWAAARQWPLRLVTLDKLLDQAEREARPVVILTTAPRALDGEIVASRALPANEARRALKNLEPKPWPVDRDAAMAALESFDIDGSAHVVWLSDGLLEATGADAVTSNAPRFAAGLQRLGRLDVLSDAAASTARLVLPPQNDGTGLTLKLRRAEAGVEESAAILSSDEAGRALGRTLVTFGADETLASGRIELPAELRNRITRLQVEGESSIGATLLIDERWRRRPIGLVSSGPLDSAQPLLSELFYLDRALQPFTEIRRGALDELLQRELAVIALPDGAGLLAAQDQQRLEDWLQKGGLLLRFAGPRMAAEVEDDLLPVTLRRGNRILGGTMTWDSPARLAPFVPDSPFAGLALPEDVLVDRQVLAEPALDLGEKTWARLRDGTPLVTAEARGEGRIVLFHTSANTKWSNLVLSGLFVEMLKRLLDASQGVVAGGAPDQALAPIATLNGFGALQDPPITVAAMQGGESGQPVSWRHPPGYYGSEAFRRAHNLGGEAELLRPIGALPNGVERNLYRQNLETDLRPWLLAAALLLLVVDMLVSLVLRGLLTASLRRSLAPPVSAGLLALLLVLPAGKLARAQDTDDTRSLEATLSTRLAYVITDIPSVDDTSRAGLSGLTRLLQRRTSIEAGPPLGVELARDELSFFPLLYWPITSQQDPLSERAVRKVNDYLKNGGTIFFDLRDPSGGTQILGQSSRGTEALRRLTNDLDIPKLTPVPPDHVLTKSFYLLQEFPGRFAGGTLWVEADEDNGNDGVTSVLIGSNDWAGAWAVNRLGQPTNAVVPGGPRQREMAYRVGINLVMYALTGNYKADQVHVPFILERLGQ